ncbi:LacI family DNA-binding transcriptional regulator [Paracoccus aestuariivivens]|uniref:Substrate-binding domain-containing protein n=1 Tax=Paracoccus aestuariivivens TaxID=1820333 RepID=A0A6L6JA64_9RHOB|nr:LacI family DNA-binding transcriptional regulator [Paracoccus aestuariivivens]MTH77557.1 substrate-binding domain-containing protein [Paracoccus aestuariivivens]
MNNRPGLRDLARLAGVSEATVDRVLHGRPNVRPATAERVLRAAAESRYLPEAALARLTRPDRLRLTVILPHTANAFLRQLNHDMRLWAKARDRGARIHSFMLDCIDPTQLARNLRRLGKRCDAIAFFGVDHPDVRDEVDALVASGKQVITLISDITGSKRQTYIGIDNLAAGRTAAFLLARMHGHANGKLAVIAATRQFRAHVERELGFQELILRDYSHLTLAGTIEGKDDPFTNARLTEDLLDRFPDLCGIYNVGGSSEGIALALRRAGCAGQVALIGHGLSPGTRKALEQGLMTAVLTHRHQTMFEVLLDQLQSSRQDYSTILPMQIIFPTNLPEA